MTSSLVDARLCQVKLYPSPERASAQIRLIFNIGVLLMVEVLPQLYFRTLGEHDEMTFSKNTHSFLFVIAIIVKLLSV